MSKQDTWNVFNNLKWHITLLRICNSKPRNYEVELDYIFKPQVTQEKVYKHIGISMVDDFLNGYNVTLMLYGQTNSEKSW